MGVSQTEANGQSTEQGTQSDLHDQATALDTEVRELREGYDQLVARIDDALADTYEEKQGELDDREEVSGRELCLINLALEGYTREEAGTRLVELFGEGDYENAVANQEILDRVFSSTEAPRPRPRGRFLRRS